MQSRPVHVTQRREGSPLSGLFDNDRTALVPLAERLRPKHIDEVIGQAHLLGEGKPLRLAFEAGKLHSMILWGPPGVGKTTLARLMAGAVDAEFQALSAVFSGVKDIREAVARAQQAREHGRATVLFVDEVHRFNKAQQDAFLPFVEQGFFFIDTATTENPSFEVNSALLSRASVYVLHALAEADLRVLLRRAQERLGATLRIDDDAISRLCGFSDGDGRRLLNLVEQLLDAAKASRVDEIGPPFVDQVLARSLQRFDKGGDAFYDQISALHKSIRGSDPDAALYWLCRMLEGGVDPHYLGRRLVRMASEDIGLADPRALEISLNACAAYDRLGSPEGELALAEAAVFLACAAKSNAVYVAYKAARKAAADHGSLPVPLHLRNAPTRLMKGLGHGKAYRYAHDEPEGYAAGEHYLPDGIDRRPGWYRPVARGLETRIAEKLARLRALDEAWLQRAEPGARSEDR